MKISEFQLDLLESQFSSAASYRRAYERFEVEDYAGALECLQELEVCDHSKQQADRVESEAVLELLCWCYFYKRDYGFLSTFFADYRAAQLDRFVGLNLLRLWGLLAAGNISDTVSECDRFIDKNSNPIHSRLGGYLFLRALGLAGQGRHGEAIESGEMGFYLLKLSGRKLEQYRCANNVGIFYRKISDYRESLKWYLRALPYFENANHLCRVSMVCLNLGVTYYKLGDYDNANLSLTKSLRLGEKVGLVHRQCMANIAIGNLHCLKREFGQALEVLNRAMNQAQEIGFAHEEALSLESLGDVYRDKQAWQVARRFYARARAIAELDEPVGDIVRGVLRKNGECYNLEGDQGQALTYLNKSLEMAHQQDDRFEEAVTLRVMYETTVNSGDVKSARRYIDESIKILEEIDAHHELAISLMGSVNLTLQEIEDPRRTTPRIVRLNQAWKQATKALDLLIKVDVAWWTKQARTLVARVSSVREAQEKTDKETMATGKATEKHGYTPGTAIIFRSRVMRDMIQLCDMFATTDEPVLITGETGTGKEIVARRLHMHSNRVNRPLVVVNVAAIPDTMFEREFFGHVKGAFSGAVQDGEGYAARANGGTLFLDEIGELPLELQPKLLRLLQEKTYRALGDPKQRHTDIRLVAATNADLETMVRDGRFRADLYYRLRILDLSLPAVRERSEDVLPLMRHFLCVAAKRPVDLSEYFEPATLEALEAYEWPGNVREIAMIARQSHVSLQALGRVDMKLRKGTVGVLNLTGQQPGAIEAAAGGCEVATVPAVTQSEAVERARILVALDEAGGNRNLAARTLGIGRSTIYRKMVKYGIPTRRTEIG